MENMEPVAYIFKPNNEALLLQEVDPDRLLSAPELYRKLYSAEQLATLRAKLEQAEKAMEELLRDLHEIKDNNASNRATEIITELLDKYEVQK